MRWEFKVPFLRKPVKLTITNETKARAATAVAGIAGAWAATKIPGIDEATATQVAIGVLFGALGLSVPHPATERVAPVAGGTGADQEVIPSRG